MTAQYRTPVSAIRPVLRRGGKRMTEYARRQAFVRRPVITEEPVISIHLLNEIRKVCEGCGLVGSCANAKSAAALTHCQKIKDVP